MASVRDKAYKAPELRAIYDRPVDVLVIIRGKPVPVEGDGRPGGVELDYSLDDGSPHAVKVIGYFRNGWQVRTKQLVSIISDHLVVDPRDVERKLAEVVK